jgi:hypothetical protein
MFSQSLGPPYCWLNRNSGFKRIAFDEAQSNDNILLGNIDRLSEHPDIVQVLWA